MTIRPPPTWFWDTMAQATHPLHRVRPGEYWTDPRRVGTVPEVRHIDLADLKTALIKGAEDVGAFRTDVFFLCTVYPIVGLLLARLAAGYELLPLVFPLVSGFALIGPFAAVGLNEMSRRRELGLSTGWAGHFAVLQSPARARIMLLGFALTSLLLLWLIAANLLYGITVGPEAPVSIESFFLDVVTTRAGWAMTVVGISVGFVFALIVLTLSSVAFPMMLDRNVTVDIAIRTSLRVARANKRAIAIWGAIVASLLAIGSVPALLGLIVVMPLLGHATWHLYRAAVPR